MLDPKIHSRDSQCRGEIDKYLPLYDMRQPVEKFKATIVGKSLLGNGLDICL